MPPAAAADPLAPADSLAAGALPAALGAVVALDGLQAAITALTVGRDEADDRRAVHELATCDPALSEMLDQIELLWRHSATHGIKPGIVHGAFLLDHVTDP